MKREEEEINICALLPRHGVRAQHASAWRTAINELIDGKHQHRHLTVDKLGVVSRQRRQAGDGGARRLAVSGMHENEYRSGSQ